MRSWKLWACCASRMWPAHSPRSKVQNFYSVDVFSSYQFFSPFADTVRGTKRAANIRIVSYVLRNLFTTLASFNLHSHLLARCGRSIEKMRKLVLRDVGVLTNLTSTL